MATACSLGLAVFQSFVFLRYFRKKLAVIERNLASLTLDPIGRLVTLNSGGLPELTSIETHIQHLSNAIATLRHGDGP